MANQTRQQVADQLNKLNSQGASEQQIIDYVNSAGYKPDDFNVDLNGSFRPMVVGTGTVTQNYSAAELQESNSYYENLAASSSTVTPRPTASVTSGSTTTKTVTTTEITNFQQTTGGGTTTVYATPSTDTSTSLAYKAEASQAASLAESYRLNPDSKFGKSALDKRLADGRISQEQYNEIVNSTPEQRREKSLEYSAQYEQARTNEISTQTPGQPIVEVTPAQNTSSITVDYQKVTSTSSSTLSGPVPGTNVTTETVEGVTYQITNDSNGNKVYTSPDNVSFTDTESEIENQRIVENGPATGTPYDDDGNLNVGWGLDENGEPVWVGAGYVDATGETFQSSPETVSGPTGTPYDDDGNLNVGWGLDENGNPVWVGAGYVDATGETFQSSPETVSGPTGTPYDDDGNLNVGWGLDENGNPVWVGAGYIDATGETIQPQKTVSGPTGTPYDDDGNLNPGWTLDEENNPVWVGGDFVEPATQASAESSRQAATNQKGLASTTNAQAQATEQDVSNFYQTGDWRVRLSLAPGANYLYKASDPGILLPLNATNGVIFPYTPAISVVYAAQYDPFDLTHSNYKSYNYKSSSVDQISITCEFTAQDTFEANYLLAVIHFFRSVTKMFYGQDEKPDLGTPPPLCYLSGLGAFQFDKHPLAITSFNYSLPTDVDYIRATHTTTSGGVNKSASNSGITPTIAQIRGAPTGGNPGSPKWQTNTGGSVTPTYVPTKMQIQLSAVPIVSRNDISRAFSLRKYATGDLLRGSKRNGGGIW